MTYAFQDRDKFFWAVDLAEHVAALSKDPSTKVGAAIFDGSRRLISVGYNGFARGVNDKSERLEDRETKYKMILHAEKNAIAFATQPLHGATLFCTHPCCTQCAAMVIQVGIKHVCWPMPAQDFIDRWLLDLRLSAEMFEEAGVTVHVR